MTINVGETDLEVNRNIKGVTLVKEHHNYI